MIDWTEMNTTKEEHLLFSSVADRAHRLIGGGLPDRMSFLMDMQAAHYDIPMDLGKLMAFDDSNFLHDVCGINKHINRTTGKIDDHFLPRCAKK
jgi:hypothetical protein